MPGELLQLIHEVLVIGIEFSGISLPFAGHSVFQAEVICHDIGLLFQVKVKQGPAIDSGRTQRYASSVIVSWEWCCAAKALAM